MHPSGVTVFTLLSEKRESLEDAEGAVLQGPCDMAKSWIA
jgi:hypothetical protein